VHPFPPKNKTQLLHWRIPPTGGEIRFNDHLRPLLCCCRRSCICVFFLYLVSRTEYRPS
jgi:hypothetical protein